jgi:hypothetical protein
MKEQIAAGQKSSNSFSEFLTFFCFKSSVNLTAQPGFNIYTDLGENNVSRCFNNIN